MCSISKNLCVKKNSTVFDVFVPTAGMANDGKNYGLVYLIQLLLSFLQVCNIEMSLSEFEKQNVELIPDEMIIPKKIELPQYQVEESRVSLEFINKGAILELENKPKSPWQLR